MRKEVLMIFKTHLDIGFTDYSANIVKKYLEIYIPNAIRVGYELKDSDTPFVWTVDSWLINKALRSRVQQLDKIISEAGRVTSLLTNYPA